MRDKLISADALAQGVKNWGKIKGREGASDVFLYAINNAPAADAVEKEKYNELREAFVDFVCSGIHNPAPWCKNRNEECTNVYGMCVFSNDACRGFNPDGERREGDEID